MRKRLDNGRREELLDGVMDIIAARGFSGIRTAQLARELHCSESSLYKIAPSKDSLIVVAIGRWGGRTLEALEVSARQGKTASERARLYFRAGAREHALPVPGVLRRHRALRIGDGSPGGRAL